MISEPTQSSVAPAAREASVPYRPVKIGSAEAVVQQRGDAWYLQSKQSIGAYPKRLTDRLISGAEAHPDRWLVARRGDDGEWLGISYAQMLDRARAIGQALLDRGLSAERPVVILSGNDLEHLQVALGAMWAGVPYSPISPAYSLVSTDYGKLRHAIELLRPGLVFATDGDDIRRRHRCGRAGRR